jgi:hypothetical protein
LTTLRPKLSNYKNRKFHRIKEIYPNINIKLFKRRDMRELLVKFGLQQEAKQIQGTEAQNSPNERQNHE